MSNVNGNIEYMTSIKPFNAMDTDELTVAIAQIRLYIDNVLQPMSEVNSEYSAIYKDLITQYENDIKTAEGLLTPSVGGKSKRQHKKSKRHRRTSKNKSFRRYNKTSRRSRKY